MLKVFVSVTGKRVDWRQLVALAAEVADGCGRGVVTSAWDALSELEAYRITGDMGWRTQAWSAFNWFLGENDLQVPLYDSETGGCRDGLHPDRANQNQGAESTLSFLMALLEMRALQKSEELEVSS